MRPVRRARIDVDISMAGYRQSSIQIGLTLVVRRRREITSARVERRDDSERIAQADRAETRQIFVRGNLTQIDFNPRLRNEA